MKTDKSQDKYAKIFKELKEEKMNWDFEDFLKNTDKHTTGMAPRKVRVAFPKRVLLAATVLLLISVGILLNYLSNSSINDQDNLVKNEIIKQKDSFLRDSQVALHHLADSVTIKGDRLNSDSITSLDEMEDPEVLNQILPKRGRLKKGGKPRYTQIDAAQNSAEATATFKSDYKPNYVIINGQKIENEQEAIDLTKYSFRLFSEKVVQSVAHIDPALNPNSDY